MVELSNLSRVLLLLPLLILEVEETSRGYLSIGIEVVAVVAIGIEVSCSVYIPHQRF